MAEEIAIRGSNYPAKERNPLGPIGLAIITFGIYGIFHYYYINKELAELGKARGTNELGDNPMTSVLAVTLGALIIVPAIISQLEHLEAPGRGAQDVRRPGGHRQRAGLPAVTCSSGPWACTSSSSGQNGCSRRSLGLVVSRHTGRGRVCPRPDRRVTLMPRCPA